MKKIIWEVQYLSLPTVSKYCKKCARKTSFSCSEKFRINAQRKALDTWLIYRCSDCDTTWNAGIYSRVSPQSINSVLLEKFSTNDAALAAEYAMNIDFLHKNGAEVEIPPYIITGEDFFSSETVELEIKSKYALPIKISTIIREKMHLSQTAYLQLIENGTIQSIPAQDLQKCKLKKSILLAFNRNLSL